MFARRWGWGVGWSWSGVGWGQVRWMGWCGVSIAYIWWRARGKGMPTKATRAPIPRHPVAVGKKRVNPAGQPNCRLPVPPSFLLLQLSVLPFICHPPPPPLFLGRIVSFPSRHVHVPAPLQQQRSAVITAGEQIRGATEAPGLDKGAGAAELRAPSENLAEL